MIFIKNWPRKAIIIKRGNMHVDESSGKNGMTKLNSDLGE